MVKDDTDNLSNQLNPNNDAYWQSRGFDERPDDWEQHVNEDQAEDSKISRSGGPIKK